MFTEEASLIQFDEPCTSWTSKVSNLLRYIVRGYLLSKFIFRAVMNERTNVVWLESFARSEDLTVIDGRWDAMERWNWTNEWNVFHLKINDAGNWLNIDSL